MFEKYNLITLSFTEDMTDENYSDAPEHMLSTIRETPSGEDAERYLSSPDNTGLEHAKFQLDGSLQMLPLFLVDPDLPESMLRLQSLSIMRSGADYYTRRQDYRSYLLLFTYDGEGALVYEGERHTLRRGEGFLIDCRKPQEYFTVGDSWHHLDLHFVGTDADLLFDQMRSEGTVKFVAPSVPTFDHWMEEVLEACTRPSPHRHVYVHRALYSLVTHILREVEQTNRPAVPALYRDLVSYLEANYREAISLDDLARRANMSKYHLAKEFKRHFGMPPHEYLVSLRVLNAAQLLRSTDMTVAEVCAATGFTNRTNFLRLFKKRMGVTPSEFKRVQQ